MNAAFATFRLNQSPQQKQNRLRLWGKSKRIDSLNVRNVRMKKSDTVGQLVTLPRRFHSLGNVSMFSLLEVTGYFGLHEQVSEVDIRAFLVRCPECVQEWFQYSEDKRTSRGGMLRKMMRSVTKRVLLLTPTPARTGCSMIMQLTRVRFSSSTS